MSRAAFRMAAPDDIDLGELTGSIGFLLRIAQVRIFDAFFDRLAQHGLKPGEFTVLWVIELNPGLRQGTLAQRLAIKPAHMTKLIQRLVKAGYVKRSTVENDRRSVYLALTRKGESFVADHKGDFLSFQKLEHGSLNRTESDQLCHLLRKLTAIEE